VSNDIPAKLVKQLRDETGAAMMDAKRALVETNGDLEAAKRLLRERGMASAAKRAGRETSEGIVLSSISGHVGTLVAVGCETEPVSKNDEFLAFAEAVLETVASNGEDAAQQLEGQRVEISAKLGENIALVGVKRMEVSDGESLAEYVHPPANKLGVLVKLKGENAGAARHLAMHISAGAPEFLRREDVPAEAVETERSILLASDEVKSKPEQAREKIVEGMLNKRFFGSYPGGVLLEQPWIHESGKTVAQAAQDAGLEVVAFERFALAG
jgi:elongation factor Ts